MLVIKSLHIMAMTAWFAGLFYLPRLFVYHAEASDKISLERFQTMERRLYYGITWPSGIATTFLGFWLLSYQFTYYYHAGWMHAKIGLVALVWSYHLSCGHFLKKFRKNANARTARFFRIFNEVPLLLLASIILLVVLKPF